ncbi:mRNA capping enzyme, catalytic domain-containing protein [Glomus cerebriforme]|uniref:mRNA guanylyltransferase n=1 Tax=Glomus cerebriforme TaxID=658196 RepID=A0A397TFR2_9GLOM|nr:mRNA capping enzyme, catalytic domain-containing protein [Glomus cerebriforme]
MSNTPPEVPGQTVGSQFLKDLRSRVKELVGVSNFPGAQPISFSSVHLQELQNENYFVCEKSDGTRVLVYITYDDSVQRVYLIDRKNYYRLVPNLYFPLHGYSNRFHYETLIDGELVNDKESDGKVTLKLLTFDLLVIDNKNLMNRPLTNRLGYLKDHIIKPHKEMLSKDPDLAQKQPFIIELKQMEFSYGLDKVLNTIIPTLKHKNDGLIFTSSVSGYKTGTFNKMLKWKPPNENSIDFLLRLDFSHAKSNHGKPRFCLHKWMQKDEHAYFDEMYITDKEWKEFWSHDCRQYEGRIVEVVYDPTRNPDIPWKFLRFRDDKTHGNHHSVVEKIQQSIKDGITEDQLRSHIGAIRDAWKRREEEDKSKRYHGYHENNKNERREEERLENANKSIKLVKDNKSENEDSDVWKDEEESLENGHEPKRLKRDREYYNL